MSPPTILISDDDPKALAALQRTLAASGFAVIEDSDSRVVELALRHRPKVIVLDMNQFVDGRMLLSQLKGNRETAHIPVVVLTGLNHPHVRGYCLEAGAHEYALKPLDRTFVERVAELAQRSTVPTDLH